MLGRCQMGAMFPWSATVACGLQTTGAKLQPKQYGAFVFNPVPTLDKRRKSSLAAPSFSALSHWILFLTCSVSSLTESLSLKCTHIGT